MWLVFFSYSLKNYCIGGLQPMRFATAIHSTKLIIHFISDLSTLPKSQDGMRKNLMIKKWIVRWARSIVTWKSSDPSIISHSNENDTKRCFKDGASNPLVERSFDKAPYLQIKACINRWRKTLLLFNFFSVFGIEIFDRR